jgi:hypothetical protein
MALQHLLPEIVPDGSVDLVKPGLGSDVDEASGSGKVDRVTAHHPAAWTGREEKYVV